MEAREALVRWLFDQAWSQGRTETLGERIGDLTFHYGGTERRTDGADLARLIQAWRTGFPDLRFEIHDLVVQGERAAVRARLRGTHEGQWRGIGPTGRTMDIDVMMFFRWDGQELVEVWEVDDAARRDEQLGLR